MEAFESRVLDLPDFYFTGDDYRFRFEPEAKQRLLDLLREQFNSGVRYRERTLKWDTVIAQKTAELGRYLVDRTSRLGFSEPSPNLHRTDDRELRRQILGLSQSEALRRGIRKSSFHYIRKRAKSGHSLGVYSKVQERLHVILPVSSQERDIVGAPSVRPRPKNFDQILEVAEQILQVFRESDEKTWSEKYETLWFQKLDEFASLVFCNKELQDYLSLDDLRDRLYNIAIYLGKDLKDITAEDLKNYLGKLLGTVEHV